LTSYDLSRSSLAGFALHLNFLDEPISPVSNASSLSPKRPEQPCRQVPTFLVEINGGNRRKIAVEIEGGFCMQPDGILQAFIYAQTIDEIEDQIKRRK